MKPANVLSILIFLLILSCKNSPSNNQHKQEKPKALENKSSSEVIFKRGYDDLVESLYKEQVDNNAELKDFETKIEDLSESRSDSTDLFDKYNAKNDSYYTAAEKHITQITDSVLRDKMKILVASSLAKYNSKISRHSDLIKLMDRKILTLNDLHVVLKISRTLTVIEKYQDDYLPSTRPLEGYLKQFDETLMRADTLIKE